MLTTQEKIEIIEEKVLEAERLIRYTEYPSQEEIDAQEEVGIREFIINQAYEQRQIINSLRSIIDGLKGSQ
jgi:hypothetical protein